MFFSGFTPAVTAVERTATGIDWIKVITTIIVTIILTITIIVFITYERCGD